MFASSRRLVLVLAACAGLAVPASALTEAEIAYRNDAAVYYQTVFPRSEGRDLLDLYLKSLLDGAASRPTSFELDERVGSGIGTSPLVFRAFNLLGVLDLWASADPLSALGIPNASTSWVTGFSSLVPGTVGRAGALATDLYLARSLDEVATRNGLMTSRAATPSEYGVQLRLPGWGSLRYGHLEQAVSTFSFTGNYVTPANSHTDQSREAVLRASQVVTNDDWTLSVDAHDHLPWLEQFSLHLSLGTDLVKKALEPDNLGVIGLIDLGDYSLLNLVGLNTFANAYYLRTELYGPYFLLGGKFTAPADWSSLTNSWSSHVYAGFNWGPILYHFFLPNWHGQILNLGEGLTLGGFWGAEVGSVSGSPDGLLHPQGVYLIPYVQRMVVSGRGLSVFASVAIGDQRFWDLPGTEAQWQLGKGAFSFDVGLRYDLP